MHDTPPGRPHGPEPDAGPDDAVVGELRDLMERAAAGLAPLPDLTQEAIRLGRRRRVRARAAVAGAVTGVLAIGGVGSAVLGGLGDHASAPVSPAVAPPAVPSATPPSPSPASTVPVPVASDMSETARRMRMAKALTRALGQLIGTVSVDDKGLFAGRVGGHTFPVTLRVEPGSDALVVCPDPPETAMTCRTAWLSGRIEARVVVAGGALWGGQSVSVSYLYADSTVELTVGPDTDARVSPPVSADQLVAAAGTPALLSEVKAEMEAQALYGAEEQGANPTDGASLAPPDRTRTPKPRAPTRQARTPQPFTPQPSTAESSSAIDLSNVLGTSETGGSPR
ncbi:hypothetical protein [Streptomyces sp. B21-083]|uniref:hypothetical protein n=1 Tax=Streptomyces sp. B21-083 TaxID=3039410 RepID=UPI002FF104E9